MKLRNLLPIFVVLISCMMFMEVECRLFKRAKKFLKHRKEVRVRRRRRIAKFFGAGKIHRKRRKRRDRNRNKLALEIGELLYMRERQMQSEIGCQCALLRQQQERRSCGGGHRRSRLRHRRHRNRKHLNRRYRNRRNIGLNINDVNRYNNIRRNTINDARFGRELKTIENPILATKLARSNPLLVSKILNCQIEQHPLVAKKVYRKPVTPLKRVVKQNNARRVGCASKVIVIKPIINLPAIARKEVGGHLKAISSSSPCTGSPVQEELRKDLVENRILNPVISNNISNNNNNNVIQPQPFHTPIQEEIRHEVVQNTTPSPLVPPVFRPNRNVIPKKMKKAVTTDMLGVDGLDALDVYK